MTEPWCQSGLAVLIERQVGGRGPATPGPDVRPGDDLCLWAAVGRDLREAWSDLARSGATAEMEAAARRLRGRMTGEAATDAPLFPATAAPSAGDSRQT